MKNISVTTFIHIIFILALVVISLTFYILLDTTKDQRHLQQLLKNKVISNAFLFNKDLKKDDHVLKQLYKDYSLKVVPTEKTKEMIVQHGEMIFEGSSIYGRVKVFKVGKRYFIYAVRYNFDVMLEDTKPYEYTTQLIFSIALLLVILLMALYLMVLKKLFPLKRLNDKIKRFAQGDLNVKIHHEGDDEIGKIAMSFDKAIRHIRQLISSKNLFMRNIMHELKTPITTSRIAAETIEDDMTKGILIRSFNRMNELIEDLAQIERVTMYTYAPEKKEYLISEIFDEAKKMLLKDESFYLFEYTDHPLFTDKALLALVLKNLMDNAIKYSTNKKAKIGVVGNKIMVKSLGEPLKQDLSYYTEPFSQEEKRSSGFGLGLYIVATLLEKLEYQLRYRYDKDRKENIFEIIIN